MLQDQHRIEVEMLQGVVAELQLQIAEFKKQKEAWRSAEGDKKNSMCSVAEKLMQTKGEMEQVSQDNRRTKLEMDELSLQATAHAQVQLHSKESFEHKQERLHRKHRQAQVELSATKEAHEAALAQQNATLKQNQKRIQDFETQIAALEQDSEDTKAASKERERSNKAAEEAFHLSLARTNAALETSRAQLHATANERAKQVQHLAVKIAALQRDKEGAREREHACEKERVREKDGAKGREQKLKESLVQVLADMQDKEQQWFAHESFVAAARKEEGVPCSVC